MAIGCVGVHSFIHSIGTCRIRQFLAILSTFFHSSLLCTFSCNPSPPTILPSSLIPYCHLFLGLPLNLVVPKFTYKTLLGILFSFILFTCPNQFNLFNLIVWGGNKKSEIAGYSLFEGTTGENIEFQPGETGTQ